MMPSVDHCLSKSSEMTTLTNSLEVFDTYKHREDKDSDEESFHLPLDDDESESKYQDGVEKNENGNESEDEILNKFESATSTLDPIDSHLEERLLNEEEEEKNGAKENGLKKEVKSKDSDKNCTENDTNVSKNESNCNKLDNKEAKEAPWSERNGTVSKESVTETDNTEIKNDTSAATVANSEVRKDEVPKLDLEKDANSEDSARIANGETSSTNVDIEKCDANSLDKSKNKDHTSETTNTSVTSEPKSSETQSDKDENKDRKSESEKHDKADKCENSNDSSKSQNEDSEDLFDISIIRDAEEDNAESAYNEAHPEDGQDNEDFEDRSEDKMEEDCTAASHEEEEDEEEMDIDKHDDQLKNDDVDIEETKLDCEGIKETSDGESDSGNKTDLVQSDKEQVKLASETSSGAKETTPDSGLDEITGNSRDSVKRSNVDDGGQEKSMEVDSEEKRKSLKRTIADEDVDGAAAAAKKTKTEQPPTAETKTSTEKPKEKVPLRSLLSLSEFMKSRKSARRLTMQDLEEFCLQKICEVIVHKSDLGDVHHQLKLQEQLIETMRKEIQQLTKQARDLEIVNKKLMNDLKQQTATQKPLNPLKITRSVGLQVKVTPAHEFLKKRQQGQQAPAAAPVPKGQQAAAARAARGGGVANATPSPSSRQKQQPQQQQQVQKPTTPLLSQALQTRKSTPSEPSPKPAPLPIRPKLPENKNPSASVIDLTDEDDKKDKNKNVQTKMVAQKNIAVPLRTTPVRVNAPQGLRLTTSQGKVTPITSVVTSSAPQVMYVVQSSPQNLNSPLGSKAVVVNFQSANGVLPSALNGSAVSVIPKQSNSIQLKTVPTAKQLQPGKPPAKASKHPAPLPAPPLVRVGLEKSLKPIPPKPHLTIRKTENGIILQWKMPYELDMYEVIASYQLYAYQETSAMPSTDMWRKVGDVKALALPMACTLTQFADKNKYYFAVRPVDIHKRIGLFSEPEEISL